MKINQVINEGQQNCPECGGPAFSDLLLAEKKDACYNKVRSRYKVWPSAYASGALVQCRKKGAANWGNKSEGVAEGVRDLGYDAQSLIMKLRRDVEEKRLQPTPQAVLAAARELAGDMDFAPQLLVKQVLGQGVAEGSQRVDSLVTDALKIMRGPEVSDAVAALKTVLGDREFNGRRGHYNFYIKQMIDMYGQQGVAEGYQFKGPFPFDVDHMHGGRGINLPKAETKKYFTDKKQWQRAVDDINSSKYDDNSDYIGVTGRSTVEINGREWARWSDAQQKGYIEMSSMAEQGVAEGQGDVVQVHQHQRGKDMGKYGTFNIERETPTIIVVYDHSTGEMLKFNRATGRGIGPASQLMIKQGVAEVSDATLTSYLTKLDKDNLKHRMDPTKRSDTKRMKSGPNFVKAFTKLDNRKQGVAEGSNDTIYPNAEVIKLRNGRPIGEIYQDENGWGFFHYGMDSGNDFIDSREDAIEGLRDLHQETGRSRRDTMEQGVAEGSNDNEGSADKGAWREAWLKQRAYERAARLKQQSNKKKPPTPVNKNKEQGVAEGSDDKEPFDYEKWKASTVKPRKPRGHKDAEALGKAIDSEQSELRKRKEQGVAEGYRGRRDAYQRDQDNAEYGMNKYQSRAYRADGGANDERHDLDPTDWYFVKDGKMFAISVYPRQEQEAIALGYSRTRAEARAKAGEQGVAEGDISQLEKDIADAPVEPIANMESATDSDGYAVDQEDAGEYDYEGDQAKDQLQTIVAAARKLDGILDDNENMPEWVQMKITKATDYLDTAADYVAANKAQSEPMAEADQEKIGGRHDPQDFDDMVLRLKKLAGAGPMKTVYDPNTRRYKNIPTAVQPQGKK